MADRDETPRLSDTEWTVMHAVWELMPCTAREVLERVEDETGWAYTTVRTLLQRLVDKDVLTVRRRGNQGVYEATLPRERVQRSAVRSFLDRVFGGAATEAVQHLAGFEDLSPRERRRLLDVLDEHERKTKDQEGRRRG